MLLKGTGHKKGGGDSLIRMWGGARDGWKRAKKSGEGRLGGGRKDLAQGVENKSGDQLGGWENGEGARRKTY